jgi:hypothetical protein
MHALYTAWGDDSFGQHKADENVMCVLEAAVPPSARIIDDWPAFSDAVRRVMVLVEVADFANASDIRLIEGVLGMGDARDP